LSSETVFPKSVGIVFIEDRAKRKKAKPSLNFDQDACTYFVTQMNAIQPLFIFEILNKKLKSEKLTIVGKIMEWFKKFKFKILNKKLKSEIDSYKLPKDDNIRQWFRKFVNDSLGDHPGVKCWIGITSTPIPGNLFAYSEDVAGSLISLITTDAWERYFSPPSIFEYLAFSIFYYTIESLEVEFGTVKHFYAQGHQTTRGCILDYTGWKPHARIFVSNPQLCQDCRRNLVQLQDDIHNQAGIAVNLTDYVNKVIDRKWIGDLDVKDSAAYALKKNYGYDINRNSGFYKKWYEKASDTIKDSSIGWIMTIVTAVIIAIITASLALK
jgi:hypothetical protein